MIRLFSLILIVAVMTGCNPKSNTTETMDKQKNTPVQAEHTNDTTPKVTGIGGIFFFSDNPEKTKAWYASNLGLETNEWGSSFEFRNANRPDEINYLQWSPFVNGSEYFASDASAIVNELSLFTTGSSSLSHPIRAIISAIRKMQIL
ncbi:MAG: hypothetical protein RBS07_15320 [Lentimicrobium sp.]|jgi:hypothetical protein|nr:hypothetical protein [Lentimicrobium sp.]